MSKPKNKSGFNLYYPLKKKSEQLPKIINSDDLYLSNYENPIHSFMREKITELKNKKVSLKTMLITKQKFNSVSTESNLNKFLTGSNNNNFPIDNCKKLGNTSQQNISRDKILNIDASTLGVEAIRDNHPSNVFNPNRNLKRISFEEDLKMLLIKFNYSKSTIESKSNIETKGTPLNTNCNFKINKKIKVNNGIQIGLPIKFIDVEKKRTLGNWNKSDDKFYREYQKKLVKEKPPAVKVLNIEFKNIRKYKELGFYNNMKISNVRDKNAVKKLFINSIAMSSSIMKERFNKI